MPCSALMLPPWAATRSWTIRLAAGPCCDERFGRGAFRRGQVVVQVAVAEVAEGHEAQAGQRARERRAASSRNRGIAETGSEMSCLMFGPSRRCASAMFSRSVHSAFACVAGLRDRRIAARSRARSPRRARLRAGRRPAIGGAVVGLHQHVPRMAGQRIGQRRNDACATARATSADISSKPTSRSPSASLQHAQQCDGRAERRPRAASAVAFDARRRKQLQHRGGDDAERAFGADEQLLQVVAGVVLAQAAQAVPDAAVGQHHLDAEHQLARVAVAQHRGAAGVGREIAADRAAALGGERQRKHHAGVGGAPPARRRASRRPRRSASRCRRSTARTRFIRVERQHDRRRPTRRVSRRRTGRCCRPAATIGAPRPAQARTTAATSAVLARAHDGLRAAVIAAAPVGEIGGDVGRRGEDVRGADDGVEPREQGCANVRHGRG